MIAYAAMFESQEKAQATADKLVENGFEKDQMCILESASEAGFETAKKDDFLTGIEKRVQAQLDDGQVVLAVKAIYGQGRVMEMVMAESEPTKVIAESPAWVHFSEFGGLSMIRNRNWYVGVVKGTLSNVLPLILRPKADRKGGYGGLPLLKKGTLSPLGALPTNKHFSVFPMLKKKGPLI